MQTILIFIVLFLFSGCSENSFFSPRTHKPVAPVQYRVDVPAPAPTAVVPAPKPAAVPVPRAKPKPVVHKARKPAPKPATCYWIIPGLWWECE